MFLSLVGTRMFAFSSLFVMNLLTLEFASLNVISACVCTSYNISFVTSDSQLNVYSNILILHVYFSVNIPEAYLILSPPQTAMVVGYDVYHDSNSRDTSFGAVVSSINDRCTRYYGQVNAHKNQEELSDNFSVNITSELDSFLIMSVPAYRIR